MTSREVWDRYLRVYDALNLHEAYQDYLEDAVSRLRVATGQRVLDAGSGTGSLSLRLRSCGAEVVSLDFSPVALAAHRRKDPSALLVMASLEDALPFASGRFNHVVCASVLFSLSAPGMRRALREFRRVLVPGGLLLVTAMRPGQSKLGFAWDHVATRYRSQTLGEFVSEMKDTVSFLARIMCCNLRLQALGRYGQYRRFTKEALISEICEAGFNISRYSHTFSSRFHLVEAVATAEVATVGGAQGMPANGI